ncbi:MAG TPA: chemotaxis protein CheB [Bacteroidales bacterium]|nr:chemotaxis protein CheB [Bacteroidales bacterium]
MIQKPEIIVIGGSAGSYSIVRKILASLPANFSIPVVLVLHRLKEARNGFDESLNNISKIKVTEPLDKQRIAASQVYLSPANYHLFIEKNKTFALSISEEENYSRPAIDITFDSACDVYGEKLLSILLSGANGDGAAGILNCHEKKAYTIVQDPAEALFNIMPNAALRLFSPHELLTSDKIIELLNTLNQK